MINPMIMKTVMGLATAPYAGHMALVTGAAMLSSFVNYKLEKRGKVLLVKIANRLLWIAGGVVYLDVFFGIGHSLKFMFHL